MLSVSEEWRVIPGYPDYEASSAGRIRSWRRRYPGGPRLLKQQPHKGYLQVSVFDEQGHQKSLGVHCAVLMAFEGPRPLGMEARHILNNNRCDNRRENLAWGTRLENAADRIPHGTNLRVERRVLSDDDVLRIRESFRYGAESCAAIARREGVAASSIEAIVHGTDRLEAGGPAVSRNIRLRGVHHLDAKLCDESVREIRRLHAGGASLWALSKRFGVTHRSVQKAALGITWRHVS